MFRGENVRSLGFEPNKDFERAREVTLGKRPESLQALEFGKEGKLFIFRGLMIILIK